LCSGLARAKHVDLGDRLLKRRHIHFRDFGAGDRGLAVADVEHFGDRRSGDLVVAGDHRHADAPGVAFLHRLDRFLARRVEKADKPKQHEVLRQIGRAEASGLDAGIGQPGERQHPLALACENVGRFFEKGAVERLRTGRVLLPVASVEDRLGRAFNEQDLAAFRGLMQSRHEPVFGFEGDGVDARIGGLFRLPIHSELRRERIERALGRITLDFP
jgi:hypothetical protein